MENPNELENHIPSPVFSEEHENKRLDALTHISTKIAMRQRDNSSFITANKPLNDIAEAVQKPAMIASTAISIPGLALAAFSVIMGAAFTLTIINVLVALLCAGLVTLLYWNIVSRLEKFSLNKSFESIYNNGFSSKQRGVKRTFHGVSWHFLSVLIVVISLGLSAFSAWKVALATGYQPKSIADNRNAHFSKYDADIDKEQQALDKFIENATSEKTKVENSGKYNWRGALVPEGKKRIENIDKALATEQTNRQANIDNLRKEKMKLYDDGMTQYKTQLSDMAAAANDNGLFAVIFILIVDLSIIASVWMEQYYISGCLKEMYKQSASPTPFQEVAPVVAPVVAETAVQGQRMQGYSEPELPNAYQESNISFTANQQGDGDLELCENILSGKAKVSAYDLERKINNLRSSRSKTNDDTKKKHFTRIIDDLVVFQKSTMIGNYP